MPACDICHKPFSLTREDERLVLRGLMAPVCDECAIKTKPVIEPLKPLTKKKTEVINPREFNDLAAAELIEAYLYTPDGNVTQVMRSPKRVDGKPAPLIKPKRMVVHVTVVSEGVGHHTTMPRIRLHTNLIMCQTRKQDFWVRKVPSFCCDLTGIDKFDIPRKEVKEYLRESRTIAWVKKKDGGAVKLVFQFIELDARIAAQNVL